MLLTGLWYCIPSTTSTDEVISLDSSIITTPVFATLLKAPPISLPSSVSLFEEIVATWSIISPVTSMELSSRYFTTFLTAVLIPNFNSLELISLELALVSID